MECSVLGPLLFLVYINDLPEGLNSNVKLFVEDTSIFSVVRDSRSSSRSLNEDLSKIIQWVYKWEMLLFEDDASKQAQEVVFSRKKNSSNHNDIYFNNMPLNRKIT